MKRVGRGYGSGKGGHTVGHGQKGQKSRGNKIHILFEGYKSKKSLIKRLPLRRGKGKLKPVSKVVTFSLSDLESFPKGSKVTVDALAKKFPRIPKSDLVRGVKILGTGKLTQKLTLMVPATAGAIKKIEKAGGEVLSKTKA